MNLLTHNATVSNNREDLIKIYRKRAKYYNFFAKVYDIVFNSWTYRKQAVKELNLRRGDTVVDLGCGTGVNFSLLEKAVGSKGKIIGVDLTDAMLAQARKRVEKEGWSNVELVQSDAALFEFPTGVDGIVSTFALTLVPEFDQVIQNGCQTLSPGKRWVVLDLKVPSNPLARFAPLLAFVFVRPFGGTMEMATRHPWESINKYLKNPCTIELFMGFVYIAIGER
ncbi:MAG TPA: methyltransferase type 11 [Cyanobacteria bacterium UBA12227]|nr:methyltransferase type 11 [Cyanobacteria bacterium UBA12227]